jgi:hypothetical protein
MSMGLRARMCCILELFASSAYFRSKIIIDANNGAVQERGKRAAVADGRRGTGRGAVVVQKKAKCSRHDRARTTSANTSRFSPPPPPPPPPPPSPPPLFIANDKR